MTMPRMAAALFLLTSLFSTNAFAIKSHIVVYASTDCCYLFMWEYWEGNPAYDHYLQQAAGVPHIKPKEADWRVYAHVGRYSYGSVVNIPTDRWYRGFAQRQAIIGPPDRYSFGIHWLGEIACGEGGGGGGQVP